MAQDLHYLTVPVKSPTDRKTVTTMSCPYVLPHELYAYLMDLCEAFIKKFLYVAYSKLLAHNAYNIYPTPCEDTGRIRDTDEELEEYWTHQASRAAAAGRPPPVGFQRRSAPLGFYGDDARYNRHNDKIILVTFNSILDCPQSA